METKNHSSLQIEDANTIARFKCKASAGIGYAYWMRIDYKNPISISVWENEWQCSEKLGSVTVGLTKYIELANVPNLKEGAKVRFRMDVKASSKDQVAEQEYIFWADSQWQAVYDGRGSVFSPKLEFESRRLYQNPNLIDPAIGYCRPVVGFKRVDHTYVQVADIYFECHGGVDNGKEICSGMSDVNFTEQTANGKTTVQKRVKINDGNAGITYGLTGVCHQIANRLLELANVKVNSARGYAGSCFLYGEYGWG